MENNFYPERTDGHTSDEFKKLWASQKVIRDWTNHPEWESYNVIPVLYKALHTGERLIPGASNAPTLAEVVRTTEATLSGFPENLLSDSRHVYILASKYSTKLDEILRQKPKTTQQAIEDAAFSYYVFERIHPLSAGNGRIGRSIVKRVFKGGGLRDPIFHDLNWYGKGRSPHLDALEEVGETNNLAHLEVFLTDSLIDMYDPFGDFFKHRELSRIRHDKQKSAKQKTNRTLTDIWEGFEGIPLYGNYPNVEKTKNI